MDRQHAEPIAGASMSTVVLRVSSSDARRIVRALDETSLRVAHAPGGSYVATAYRRLAADVSAQTHDE